MNILRKVWVGTLLVVLIFGGFTAAEANAAVGGPIPPACNTELITNGSFEIPALVNPQGWDVVASGQNGIGWLAEWVDATPLPGKPVVANIELQNGRPAQDGTQYTELDSDYDGTPNPLPGDEASVRIYQDVLTNPGSSYTLVFYTSPIPGFDSSNNVTKFHFGDPAAPALVASVIEDGTANATTVWTKHEYTLTATTPVTRISFTDGGIANSFGAFLDMVSAKEVCAGGGGGGGAVTYEISGKVWSDASNNGALDVGESALIGWQVFIDADNDGDLDPGETMAMTDGAGEYALTGLSAGTYIVREVVENGWTQTYPTVAQQKKYEVTVVAANVVGINFGNFHPTGGGSGGGGSFSGGAGVVLIPTPTPVVPTPTVAGDSTTALTIPVIQPTPQVLGVATELPRTGVSGMILVLLAVCSTLFGLRMLGRLTQE
ncbi:MAG: hypothetical protein KBD66_02275 [Candidatus Doudnabacteria bacterium]|nr:hypothetical protein [Candidatus Doudnabacteria bacterium]